MLNDPCFWDEARLLFCAGLPDVDAAFGVSGGQAGYVRSPLLTSLLFFFAASSLSRTVAGASARCDGADLFAGSTVGVCTDSATVEQKITDFGRASVFL